MIIYMSSRFIEASNIPNLENYYVTEVVLNSTVIALVSSVNLYIRAYLF